MGSDAILARRIHVGEKILRVAAIKVREKYKGKKINASLNLTTPHIGPFDRAFAKTGLVWSWQRQFIYHPGDQREGKRRLSNRLPWRLRRIRRAWLQRRKEIIPLFFFLFFLSFFLTATPLPTYTACDDYRMLSRRDLDEDGLIPALFFGGGGCSGNTMNGRFVTRR